MSWLNLNRKKQYTLEERNNTFDYLMYNRGVSDFTSKTSKAMFLSIGVCKLLYKEGEVMIPF